MPTSATEAHLRTKLNELKRRYTKLTERIAALDTDIGRELDLERKLTLQERHAEAITERDQVVAEMARIEQQLSETQQAPPRVIGTNPIDGATDVPRDLMAFHIQFDRPMDSGGRSLTQSGGFGLGNPEIRYDAASNTFSFTRDNPGLLRANTTVTFTVNPDRPPGTGFVDLQGVSAETFRFSFTTGSWPTDEEWATAQERASLQRQLAELRENLRLIEERKSDYVLATDVPLLLVKEYNRTLAQINDLEDRLSRLK